MIRNLTINLQVDDENLDKDVPFDIWLYQFINRLGYNFTVSSLTLDGVDKPITKTNEVSIPHADVKSLIQEAN